MAVVLKTGAVNWWRDGRCATLIESEKKRKKVLMIEKLGRLEATLLWALSLRTS
jgi:hypothetical protein